MILPAGVVQSIDANLVDIDRAWVFADQDIWSQDYGEVLLQPVSIEASDINDLRFKSIDVTLEIRADADTNSAVLWSGYAETVDDPGGGIDPSAYMTKAEYDPNDDGIVTAAEEVSRICVFQDSCTAGDPVYITSGTQTDTVYVAKAMANTNSKMQAAGVAAATTSGGATGLVIFLGTLGGQDTGLWQPDTQLYVAPAGGLTDVRPTLNPQLIGTVLRSGGNDGIIAVNPQPIQTSISCGVADATPPAFTDNGNGTATIAAFNCAISSSSDFTSPPRVYAIASATLALTDGIESYICVKYNAGTPVLYVETNKYLVNGSNVVGIYIAWRTGTELHSVSTDSRGVGLADKIAGMITRTRPYSIMYGQQLTLGISATPASRTVTISAAVVYAGVDAIAVAALNSSVGGNRLTRVAHVSGAYTFVNQTQMDNTNYDDGTNVVALGTNRYGVRWIYRTIGDDIQAFYTLGSGNYSNVAAAVAEPVPTGLPIVVQDHAVLVGRVIVQAGVNTPVQVDQVSSTSFQQSTATQHNNLDGLQGAGPDYYHLNAAQFANAQNGPWLPLAGGTLSGPVLSTVNANNTTSSFFGPYAFQATANQVAISLNTTAPNNVNDRNWVMEATGSGLYIGVINATTGVMGNGIVFLSTNGLVTTTTIGGNVSVNGGYGTITAFSFIKPGGTSAQFLKADGSVDTNTYLTGITLSGDVTGSGAATITTAIAATTVTGKVLTGYTVGSNTAIAATDTILASFGKTQAQINAHTSQFANYVLKAGDTMSGTLNIILSSAASNIVMTNSAASATATLTTTLTGMDANIAYNTKTSNWVLGPSDAGTKGIPVGAFALWGPAAGGTAYWYQTTALFQHLTNVGITGRLAVSSYPVFFGATLQSWGSGRNATTLGGTVSVEQVNTGSGDYFIVHNNCYFDGTNNRSISATGACSQIALTPAGGFSFDSFANNGANGIVSATTKFGIDSSGNGTFVGSVTSSNGTASAQMAPYLSSTAAWFGYSGLNTGVSTGAGFWAWSDGGVGIDAPSARTIALRVAGANKVTVSSSTVTVANNLSVNGAVDGGRARMQSSAYTSTGAWFGLAGQNTSDYNSQNGMRCEVDGPRLHCASGGSIAFVVNGTTTAEANAAGLNITNSIFMLSSGGGAYNTTGIFSTGSGINIGRPRASDSPYAAILSFTVGQRGGGTNYFEVADGTTYNRQVVQNETLVRVGAITYGGYATLLGNWTSANWWGIGAATTGTDSTLKIGRCNSVSGAWVSGNPITLQVDGSISTTSGNSIQSGGGFLTSASGVFSGYGLNVSTATINPGVDTGNPFFVDRGAARQLLTRGVSISAASNVNGYANPRIELADGSSVMTVDNYQQTFRCYASTSVGSATIMMTGSAAGVSFPLVTTINERKITVQAITADTTLSVGTPQILYMNTANISLVLNTDSATIGYEWKICVLSTGCQINTSNTPRTIYYNGSAYSQTTISLTQYRSYRLIKVTSSAYFLM